MVVTRDARTPSNAYWAPRPIPPESNAQWPPIEHSRMHQVQKQLQAQHQKKMQEEPLERNELHRNKDVPSYYRLELIGKMATQWTTEVLVQNGNEWCAGCVRSEMAVARKERIKNGGHRRFFLDNEGGEPLPGTSTANAATAAAGAPPTLKHIHKGPRMEDGTRVWPPPGWSPKASPRSLHEEGDSEGFVSAVQDESTADPLVPYNTGSSSNSSDDVVLQREAVIIATGPRPLATRGSAMQLASIALPATTTAPAGAPGKRTRRRGWLFGFGRTTPTEARRSTVDSTAVPTSIASSPGYSSSLSSAERLSSVAAVAAATSEAAATAGRVQQQQRHHHQEILADDEASSEEEKVTTPNEAAVVPSRSFFSSFPTTPAFLRPAHGGAGSVSLHIFSPLVALSLRFRRASSRAAPGPPVGL